ncbi:MAG: RelA/SpoT family protein, partial [Oscillospiraceae bacterium]|nr:RelA/SpoT family protein [Oscillospiraceae bacterium]
MCKTYAELEARLLSTKSDRAFDIPKIKMAYDFANGAHGNVVRQSGEPYITHPIAVAGILLDFTLDTEVIAAALLHDVVEDTDTSIAFIKKKFGREVALLVEGVTKISKVEFNFEDRIFATEEYEAENIRRILAGMSKDIRVILIKLADRLHNMRTLGFCSEAKQRRVATETLAIFAPLAHRFGISIIKDELENISLKYLDPFVYADIERQLIALSAEAEKVMANLSKIVKNQISPEIKKRRFELSWRLKSVYSIYKKIYQKNKTLDEIYDIYAMRIIVANIADCYSVMHFLHYMFTPISERFKDYIGNPKLNQYRSLHTTVMSAEGKIFEVQIRTGDMDYIANLGVAAHWKYKLNYDTASVMNENIKDTIPRDKKTAERKSMAVVRELLALQEQSDDAEDLKKSIKIDIATDEVSVFTKDGRVRTLPFGATIIDLAYNIHSELGNHMQSATINGKAAALETVLETGDIVVINRNEKRKSGPNINWVEYAKMEVTKSKIRAWFRKARRNENVDNGRITVEKELNRIGIPFDETLAIFAANSCDFKNLDDFYASIGYKGVNMTKFLPLMEAEYYKAHPRPEPPPLSESEIEEQLKRNREKKQQLGVTIDGVSDCVVKYSQCCNPLPGDDIIAYTTRGHGFSIHKADCQAYLIFKAQNGDELTEKVWRKAEWAGDSLTANAGYKAGLMVIALNIGVFARVYETIAESKLPITEINSHTLKNGNAEITALLSIKNTLQLENLLRDIGRLPNIIEVRRR